jgi:hypothetical protein
MKILGSAFHLALLLMVVRINAVKRNPHDTSKAFHRKPDSKILKRMHLSESTLDATTASGSQSALSVAVEIRGGAQLPRFLQEIKRSKPKCQLILLAGILAETLSVSLNKRASDEGSALYFACSCVMFLLWYVQCSATQNRRFSRFLMFRLVLECSSSFILPLIYT